MTIPTPELDDYLLGRLGPPPDEFLAALADDLNTPKAMSLLSKYAKAGDHRALAAGMLLLGIMAPATKLILYARLTNPEGGRECPEPQIPAKAGKTTNKKSALSLSRRKPSLPLAKS